MKQIIIEADGGSRGNPGPAGSGVVLYDAATKGILAEAAVFIGVATNNVAEYRAILTGVELANEIDSDAELIIRMDSKLVVEQMSGRWKIKHDNMADLSEQVSAALGSRKHSFEWIPREKNQKADSLANEAMDTEKTSIRKFTETTSLTDVEYNKELPSSVRAPRDVKHELTTVILVRHGRTSLTESNRLSGRGGLDPELSDLGRADAQAVAQELANFSKAKPFAHLPKPTKVLSSPLLRTRQTAQAISQELGLTSEVLEEVAEISFGEWDGHTNAEVEQKWPELFSNWRGDIQMSPPGGESLAAFDARVMQGFQKIVTDFEGETVVLVSHVMPIRGFVRKAMTADWDAYWRVSVAPCSITVLRFWGDEAAEVACVNYSGHL